MAGRISPTESMLYADADISGSPGHECQAAFANAALPCTRTCTGKCCDVLTSVYCKVCAVACGSSVPGWHEVQLEYGKRVATNFLLTFFMSW